MYFPPRGNVLCYTSQEEFTLPPGGGLASPKALYSALQRQYMLSEHLTTTSEAQVIFFSWSKLQGCIKLNGV